MRRASLLPRTADADSAASVFGSTLAALGIAALFGLSGCHAPSLAPDLPDQPLPEPLVDASLKAEIEEHGGLLGKADKAATSEDLAEQLDRTSCVLTLPPTSDRSFDLPGLYRAAVPGTLVLSKIYYCDKCKRWHAPVSATAFAITPDGACVRAALKAVEFSGDKDAPILDTLARCYFVKSDRAKAIQFEKKAIALAGGNEKLKKSLEATLDEYQKGSD